MKTLSVPELLSHFDFASEWWEYQFVDEAYLRTLHIQFQASDDKNREHYRYRAFLDALNNNVLTMGPTFVDWYIRLVELDPDRGMAGAALHDLLMSSAITLSQVKALQALPSFSEPHLQRAAAQRLLGAEISKAVASGQLESALFQECVASNDAVIQRQLLSMVNLGCEHL